MQGWILQGLDIDRLNNEGLDNDDGFCPVCINHALAAPAGHIVCTSLNILHAPAISVVVWIIVAHFHLCSLLDCYTVLEV